MPVQERHRAAERTCSDGVEVPDVGTLEPRCSDDLEGVGETTLSTSVYHLPSRVRSGLGTSTPVSAAMACCQDCWATTLALVLTELVYARRVPLTRSTLHGEGRVERVRHPPQGRNFEA